MKKAIFKKFFIVIILTSIICCIISYSLISRIFYENTVQNMVYSIKLIDYNLDYNQNLQSQIENLNPITMTDDTRITIFDLNGVVLADTSVDNVSLMENHNTRDEFIKALQNGVGDSTRVSSTINEQMLYVASLSQNNNYILRLSINFNGFSEYFPIFIPAILLSIFISVLISSIISHSFSKSITDPLLEISSKLVKVQDNSKNFSFGQYEYDELNQIVVSTAKLANTINKTMNKLKLEKNKIDYILNNMKEGFLLLDNNQNVILINHSARQMLNCENIELNKNITRYTQKLQLLNAIENSSNNNTQSTFDLKLDDEKIYSIHITNVQKNIFSNSYSGTAVLLVDVTSDRNNHKMRQEFFSNVSHELKTPITSIQGFAELLQTGMVTDEKTTKEFYTKIKKETQNMTTLINDILMISKLESHVDEVNCTDIKLKPVINDILSTYSSITQLRNITVDVDCKNDISYYCNQQQIQQLFSNLIGNAVKYNVDNGKINIVCYINNNNLVFDITDTGIGIPKSSQGRVFERFYRVDKGRSRKMGGTGLGLSIVKHIVKFYNGSIKLSSEINKGTNITVYLPINKK